MIGERRLHGGLIRGCHRLLESIVLHQHVGGGAQQAGTLRQRAIEHGPCGGELAHGIRAHCTTNRGQGEHDRHALSQRHQGNDQNEESVLEAIHGCAL